MNLQVIALKSVPYIINNVANNILTPENINKLINIAKNAIEQYGYTNKEKITETVITTVPEFSSMAEDFFKILNDCIQISVATDKSRSEEINKIIDYVISNKDMSSKELLETYILLSKVRLEEKEINSKIIIQLIKAIKTLGGTSAILFTVINISKHIDLKEVRKITKIIMKHMPKKLI